MDFSIPDESQFFATVVGTWARETMGDNREAWRHTDDLTALGVFGLLGEDAVDPDNQYLNASLVLEQLAAAGTVGPIVETMWAGGLSGGGRFPGDGWVGAALPLVREGAALVPFGMHTTWLLDRGHDGDGSAGVVPAAPLRAAHVPVCPGGAWTPTPSTTLEQADDAFAWLAYASLSLGYAQRLMDLALRQTRDRRAFRRPLLTFQAPRFALTECYQLVSGLRLSVRDSAWRRDRGQLAHRALAAAAWLLAADVGRRVAVNVHQVMGAASFPREVGVTDVTGALALLRVGNGVDRAAEALWEAWRTASPDRPSNVGGALGAGAGTSVPRPTVAAVPTGED